MLLAQGKALLILKLGLDIVNGVARLDIKRDDLHQEGLHKNQHSSTKAQE